MREEDAQGGGLQLVEARVDADVPEGLLVLRAVEAEHANPLRELLVGHGDETAVAEPEEVLRRIEAEGRRGTRPRDPPSAEGLRGVLDDRRPELGELR